MAKTSPLKFFNSPRFAALLFGGAALADLMVICLAILGFFSGLPKPANLEIYGTSAESSAEVLIASGLWERAGWGWWCGVVYCVYGVISGTISILLSPPPNPLVLWVLGTLYHALLLLLLTFRGVSLAIFAKEPEVASPLRKVALFLVGVSAVTGVVVYPGSKKLALSVLHLL